MHMKITIVKEGNDCKVQTVDGIFRCTVQKPSSSGKELQFEDSSVLEIEQLIENIFSVTQEDHQLVLEIKEKDE